MKRTKGCVTGTAHRGAPLVERGRGAGKGRGKKRIGSPGGPAPAPPMAQIPLFPLPEGRGAASLSSPLVRVCVPLPAEAQNLAGLPRGLPLPSEKRR